MWAWEEEGIGREGKHIHLQVKLCSEILLFLAILLWQGERGQRTTPIPQSQKLQLFSTPTLPPSAKKGEKKENSEEGENGYWLLIRREWRKEKTLLPSRVILSKRSLAFCRLSQNALSLFSSFSDAGSRAQLDGKTKFLALFVAKIKRKWRLLPKETTPAGLYLPLFLVFLRVILYHFAEMQKKKKKKKKKKQIKKKKKKAHSSRISFASSICFSFGTGLRPRETKVPFSNKTQSTRPFPGLSLKISFTTFARVRGLGSY